MKIKYIGRHSTWKDNIFGTQEVWDQGETKHVDDVLGSRMLRYADSFTESKARIKKTEPVKLKEVEKEPEEEMREQIQFQLDQMNRKDDIVDFVHVKYGIAMDKTGKNLASLREEAMMHIDNFGV